MQDSQSELENSQFGTCSRHLGRSIENKARTERMQPPKNFRALMKSEGDPGPPCSFDTCSFFRQGAPLPYGAPSPGAAKKGP